MSKLLILAAVFWVMLISQFGQALANNEESPEVLSGTPSVAEKPAELPVSPKFWEKEWMIIRSKDGEVIPLFHDASRIAIMLAGTSAQKEEKSRALLEKFPEIAGRESFRNVPSRGTYPTQITLHIFKLKLTLDSAEYFSLLERIRASSDIVEYVSPVVFFKGKPSLILPRVRVEFKSWHGPKDDKALFGFLEKRFPMFKPLRSRGKEEDFFLIEPSENSHEVFLRAIDLLSQEPTVLGATPILVSLDMPIRIDAYAKKCASSGSGNSSSVLVVELGKVFCYKVLVTFDSRTASLISEENDFTRITSLPFHRPDSNAVPMATVRSALVKTEVQKNGWITVSALYELSIYDSGDWFIPGFGVKYSENGYYSDNVLYLQSSAVPVKVLSEIHVMTRDLEPLIPAIPRVIFRKAVLPPPPSPVKPVEVAATEKFFAFAKAAFYWTMAHPYAVLYYFLAVFSLFMGGMLFFREVAPPVAGFMQEKIKRAVMFWASRRQFLKAQKEMELLFQGSDVAVADGVLAVRKILKRFYENRISHLKSETNEEILKAIREIEGGGSSVYRLSLSLFGGENEREEFIAKALKLAENLKKRYSFFRRAR